MRRRKKESKLRAFVVAEVLFFPFVFPSLSFSSSNCVPEIPRAPVCTKRIVVEFFYFYFTFACCFYQVHISKKKRKKNLLPLVSLSLSLSHPLSPFPKKKKGKKTSFQKGSAPRTLAAAPPNGPSNKPIDPATYDAATTAAAATANLTKRAFHRAFLSRTRLPNRTIAVA